MEAQKKQLVEAIKGYVIPDGCVVARNTNGMLTQCQGCNLYFKVSYRNEFRCRECLSLICEVCGEGREELELVRTSYHHSLHFVYCNDICKAKNVVKIKKQKTLLKRLS